MRSAIAAVALLLAACPAVEPQVGPQGPAGVAGPQGERGPVGPSTHQSGSRIKARVGTTADGARMFIGWYDAERQGDCEFHLASDGKVRCLPIIQEAPPAKLFEDSACSKKIAQIKCFGLECPAPDAVLMATGESVIETGTVERIGHFDGLDSFGSRGDNAVFQTDGATCSPTTAWGPFLRLAAETPASEFAARGETIE